MRTWVSFTAGVAVGATGAIALLFALLADREGMVVDTDPLERVQPVDPYLYSLVEVGGRPTPFGLAMQRVIDETPRQSDVADAFLRHELDPMGRAIAAQLTDELDLPEPLRVTFERLTQQRAELVAQGVPEELLETPLDPGPTL